MVVTTVLHRMTQQMCGGHLGLLTPALQLSPELGKDTVTALYVSQYASKEVPERRGKAVSGLHYEMNDITYTAVDPKAKLHACYEMGDFYTYPKDLIGLDPEIIEAIPHKRRPINDIFKSNEELLQKHGAKRVKWVCGVKGCDVGYETKQGANEHIVRADETSQTTNVSCPNPSQINGKKSPDVDSMIPKPVIYNAVNYRSNLTYMGASLRQHHCVIQHSKVLDNE